MSNQIPPPEDTSVMAGAVKAQISRQTDIYMNLDITTIITTEDKVRLCLQKHLDQLNARKAWMAPAGIFATLAVTLATASFEDAILKASTWEAIFFVTGAVVLIWLFRTLKSASKAPSIEDVVAELKPSGVLQNSGVETSPTTNDE